MELKLDSKKKRFFYHTTIKISLEFILIHVFRHSDGSLRTSRTPHGYESSRYDHGIKRSRSRSRDWKHVARDEHGRKFNN